MGKKAFVQIEGHLETGEPKSVTFLLAEGDGDKKKDDAPAEAAPLSHREMIEKLRKEVEDEGKSVMARQAKEESDVWNLYNRNANWGEAKVVNVKEKTAEEKAEAAEADSKKQADASAAKATGKM